MTTRLRDRRATCPRTSSRVLRDYLRVVDVSSVSDLPIIRWEIQAAGVAQDTRRIAALGRPVPDRDPTLEYFHLVPRSLFLSLFESLSERLQMPEAIGIRTFERLPTGPLRSSTSSSERDSPQRQDNRPTGHPKLPGRRQETPDNLADIPYRCLALIQTLGPTRVERRCHHPGGTIVVPTCCGNARTARRDDRRCRQGI